MADARGNLLWAALGLLSVLAIAAVAVTRPSIPGLDDILLWHATLPRWRGR